MSTIKSFRLQNFKGIELVKLDMAEKVRCPVVTLIGLNESGKTTILEGLSHSVSGDKSVSGLFEGVHAKTSGAALIPITKKANFSSKIEISALVSLDETDFVAIQKSGKELGLIIDIEKLGRPFEVTRRYSFQESVLEDTKNQWSFDLETKRTEGGKFKPYTRPTGGEPDLWLNIVRIIESKLPHVSYFPTFLVDMPSKIYLQEHEGEKAVNRQYRYVFQEILDSLNEGLTLEKHVCKRISDFKASTDSVNWFSMFFGGPSRQPVDSVFQKISNTVTKQVLGSWQRVFRRANSAKNIIVEWNIDTEKDNLPYASFSVSDGESKYAISDRSLGFRWFFSFLLFTAFKQFKDRGTIFVFDEPAANLHARAQAELLKSFDKIASDGNKIIYSTHSHHMINPQWLSGAYIVENTSIDYDENDSFELSTKPTNIRITKYRDFVSQHPKRTSYFQPVIEKLEYSMPEIIGSAPFAIIEGITDYYALKLAAKLSGCEFGFRLIPGVGSGSSGPLISLLLGRGERFIVLLDDDKAGRKEAQRYKDEWFLNAATVITLADVDAKFIGFEMENLISKETVEMIRQRIGQDEKPNKKQIGWYLAEMCASSDFEGSLCGRTVEDLSSLLNHIDGKLQG